MKNMKLDKFLAIGVLIYSLSMLISHLPFNTHNLSGYFNNFLLGAGVSLIVVGLIPNSTKKKINNFKRSLFIKR